MTPVADERPSDPSFDVDGRIVKFSSESGDSATSKVPIKSHGTVGAWSGHRSRGDEVSSEKT